jgi:type II secretory pathway pseudopilin PulG
MVTRTARATYYIAICVFLMCLVALVVKMTFWPVCGGGSPCDGWTVAGLVAAILGVSTAFLGILGAVALAAWWTSLDKRVEDHVTHLFTAQIQAVQDTINQLKERADELRGKVDAIETIIPELELRINAAQKSATRAFEANMPGYDQSLESQRKQNEIRDTRHTLESEQ